MSALLKKASSQKKPSEASIDSPPSSGGSPMAPPRRSKTPSPESSEESSGVRMGSSGKHRTKSGHKGEGGEHKPRERRRDDDRYEEERAAAKAKRLQESIEHEQQVVDTENAPQEVADAMVFDAAANKWVTSRTNLKVAVRALSDKRENCVTVRIKDENEEKLQVLKVRLKEPGSPTEVLDEVMRQALASKLQTSFTNWGPPFLCPQFLPCRVYILLQRHGVPTVRGEELLEQRKRKIPLSAEPASRDELDEWESNKFFAFQFFSYNLSRKAYLVQSVSQYGPFWTDPVIYSWDKSMGDADKGSEGISAWKTMMAERLGEKVGKSRSEMFSTEPDAFISLMQEHGLFGPFEDWPDEEGGMGGIGAAAAQLRGNVDKNLKDGADFNGGGEAADEGSDGEGGEEGTNAGTEGGEDEEDKFDAASQPKIPTKTPRPLLMSATPTMQNLCTPRTSQFLQERLNMSLDTGAPLKRTPSRKKKELKEPPSANSDLVVATVGEEEREPRDSGPTEGHLTARKYEKVAEVPEHKPNSVWTPRSQKLTAALPDDEPTMCYTGRRGSIPNIPKAPERGKPREEKKDKEKDKKESKHPPVPARTTSGGSFKVQKDPVYL